MSIFRFLTISYISKCKTNTSFFWLKYILKAVLQHYQMYEAVFIISQVSMCRPTLDGLDVRVVFITRELRCIMYAH